MNIHYLSDFDFILKTEDDRLPLKDYNWTLTMSNGSRQYVASHINGEWRNCHVDDGEVHIICNNHGLGLGKIDMVLTVYMPNNHYPSSFQKVVVPLDMNIILVGFNTGPIENMTANVNMPVVIISAYEMAKELGYTGTAEEYYNSLVNIPAVGDTSFVMTDTDGASVQVGMMSVLDGTQTETPQPTTPTEPTPETPTKFKYKRPTSDYVCDGIIPINAVPGNVYRNHCLIKLGGGESAFDEEGCLSVKWGAITELMGVEIDPDSVSEWLVISYHNDNGESPCWPLPFKSREEFRDCMDIEYVEETDTMNLKRWDNRVKGIYLRLPQKEVSLREESYVRKGNDGKLQFSGNSWGKPVRKLINPPKVRDIGVYHYPDRTGKGGALVAPSRKYKKIQIQRWTPSATMYRDGKVLKSHGISRWSPTNKITAVVHRHGKVRGCIIRARYKYANKISEWAYFVVRCAVFGDRLEDVDVRPILGPAINR